jgi:hypothetical protein
MLGLYGCKPFFPGANLTFPKKAVKFQNLMHVAEAIPLHIIEESFFFDLTAYFITCTGSPSVAESVERMAPF